jgi:uncharacterized protein (DUF2267 family)
MSVTGLDVFNTTVDKTNAWLIDLMEYLRCSRHDAYIALRPTLHALRRSSPRRGGGAAGTRAQP